MKKNSNEIPNLENSLDTWALIMSNYTSFHGVSWFAHFEGKCAKVTIFTFGMIVLFALPIFLAVATYSFLSDAMSNLSFLTSVETETSQSFLFPNITICHPLYFDKFLMQDFNVSNDLANYLIYAVDSGPAVSADQNYSVDFPQMQIRFKEAEQELKNVLTTKKQDIQGLFKAIAVSCSSLIVYCEIQGKVYLGPECCSTFFNEEPVFGTKGSCFTSQQDIVAINEFNPSRIKIWIAPNLDRSPELKMEYLGGDALVKFSPVIGFSHRDHPIDAIEHDPIMIAIGSVATIGLSQTRMDRSSLNRNFLTLPQNRCRNPKDDVTDNFFQQFFGLPYTYKNCQANSQHTIHPNCSFAILKGKRNAYQRPACHPRDVLQLIHNQGKDFHPLVESFQCQKECEQVLYNYEVSLAIANMKPLGEYFRSVNITYKGDMAGFDVYFKSFEFTRQRMYQSGIDDFLSKLGGWLGFAIGASILSVLEIYYLLFTLIKILVSHFVRRCMNSQINTK